MSNGKYYPGKLSQGFGIVAKAGIKGLLGLHKSQKNKPAKKGVVKNTPMKRSATKKSR